MSNMAACSTDDDDDDDGDDDGDDDDFNMCASESATKAMLGDVCDSLFPSGCSCDIGPYYECYYQYVVDAICSTSMDLSGACSTSATLSGATRTATGVLAFMAMALAAFAL